MCQKGRLHKSLSYTFPYFYPMPSFGLVMESIPGTCDLYGGRAVCETFSNGTHFEPEFQVREAILSTVFDKDP